MQVADSRTLLSCPLQGYEKLMRTLGSDLVMHLENLNKLHLHLSLSMPAMSPPAFKVGALRSASDQDAGARMRRCISSQPGRCCLTA